VNRRKLIAARADERAEEIAALGECDGVTVLVPWQNGTI
jgi:hypothetical protein